MGIYVFNTRLLEKLLADPETVDDYRARARERAERYSWESVARRHVELYERLHDRIVRFHAAHAAV